MIDYQLKVWSVTLPLNLLFILLVLLGCAREPKESRKNAKLEFLGATTITTGFTFQDTEMGGLSGIDYDASNDVYYAISDDRSKKNSARFYTLKIDIDPVKVTPVRVAPVRVTPVGVKTLLAESGEPFAPLSLDPEGIALKETGTPGTAGTLFIASEGDSDRLIPPFIKEFSLPSPSQSGKTNQAQLLQSLLIPEKFLPVPEASKGVRNNLAFESLAITPNQETLFVATENALLQDGYLADINAGSPCRILQYNLLTGQPEREYLYMTEPLAAKTVTDRALHGFGNNGLVELIAESETRLLSLERSFTRGVGNRILIFEVSLAEATNISSIESLSDLSEIEIGRIKPARKRLLLDLQDLDLKPDNIEGFTFGPELADGRRSLILVSDNNFNPKQITQILAFALAD